VDSAWNVRVTPIARAGDAVTFRIQWTRARDNGRPSSLGADTTLTMNPNQWMTLDVMHQADPTLAPSCGLRSLTLKVGVEPDPAPDQDRRLLGVDLWLVERLADGKERSQSLSLRGLYRQAMPFYFDSITEGAKALDIFGKVEVIGFAGNARVRLTTQTRACDMTLAMPRALRSGRPGYYVGAATGTLDVSFGETVSVAFPSIERPCADGPAFADRHLSYRLRVRQLR
jgi:hypothetical protein